MQHVNRVSLCGDLSRMIASSEKEGKMPFCSFVLRCDTLPTESNYRNELYAKCNVFGFNASLVSKKIQKGDSLKVNGYLKYVLFKDKNGNKIDYNGNKGEYVPKGELIVIVDEITLGDKNSTKYGGLVVNDDEINSDEFGYNGGPDYKYVSDGSDDIPF